MVRWCFVGDGIFHQGASAAFQLPMAPREALWPAPSGARAARGTPARVGRGSAAGAGLKIGGFHKEMCQIPKEWP